MAGKRVTQLEEVKLYVKEAFAEAKEAMDVTNDQTHRMFQRGRSAAFVEVLSVIKEIQERNSKKNAKENEDNRPC